MVARVPSKCTKRPTKLDPFWYFGYPGNDKIREIIEIQRKTNRINEFLIERIAPKILMKPNEDALVVFYGKKVLVNHLLINEKREKLKIAPET